MKLVFGIIDKERNQIISMRECLTDILDEWNDLSCDYHRHQLIMFDKEKLTETALWGWTRRLNISKATMNALLLELESLARKPVSDIQVRKVI
jgi:hypothetical protein